MYIPCEICVCLPMCKNKPFSELVKCKLVNKYFTNLDYWKDTCILAPEDILYVTYLEKAMEKTKWYHWCGFISVVEKEQGANVP